jgi:hypothetical protein
MPIESNCIKFNNSEINSLQRYGIANSWWIIRRVVQRLSQHNLKISNHRHIQKVRQKQ